MAKTKIYKDTWARTPNAFYVSAMRTTDNNNAAVECQNQQWLQATALFHTTFVTLDNAYQRSMVSFSTQTIAEKDEERDQWGQVIEQVAKQWMRMPDPAMAIHGRRVWQVFQDIGFRASEALVAENEKVTNIEQRLSFEAALGLALQTMGLTETNRRFATLTQEIVTLMQERNLENSTRVQGELKAARTAMDEVFADYVELTNALIVTGAAPELEPLAQMLNAEYKKIEEQMAQSRRLPTVLVKSDIVGNHRYPVPELSKCADIVAANDKALAIDPSTDCIVSLGAKAKKVGGLFLALGGVAVRPTDSVDAKKEYALVAMDGVGSGEVTPVRPE
ncbi:MAG: hypothetical protein IKN21_05815 [Prevotella sp.]|nr:hypothetical protein [Prevotella sp.]